MLDKLRSALTGKDHSSVEEQLRFWLFASNTLIAIGLFGFILAKKMALQDYFGTSDWQTLIYQATTLNEAFWSKVIPYARGKGNVMLLSIATLVWYLRYSHAVRHEMDVLVRFYSKFNPPENWQSVIGSQWVPMLAIGLTAAFITLAYFVDRLELYCIVMLLINVMDIRGNSMIRRNLTEHFADSRYLPLEGDFYRPFISRRRGVATEYWIYRPQIERIGLMMIATMTAFLLLFAKHEFEFASDGAKNVVTVWLPYLIVIAVIVSNEITMRRWRRARDQDLRAIERDEEEAERIRDNVPAFDAQ